LEYQQFLTELAQAAAKLVLEPLLDPIFDKDSYGYRPNKSAHDAVAITGQRCWVNDFVVEFDITYSTTLITSCS
jgi:RNA-directed DNA polymerase